MENQNNATNGMTNEGVGVGMSAGQMVNSGASAGANPGQMTGVGTNDEVSEAEMTAMLADKSEDEMLTMFVQQILIDKGYVHLDMETRKRFIAEMKEQLTNYINEAIVAALPDDKLDELDRSLNMGTATPETINQLVESSGVDVSGVVQKTMLDFRAAYLGSSVTV